MIQLRLSPTGAMLVKKRYRSTVQFCKRQEGLFFFANFLQTLLLDGDVFNTSDTIVRLRQSELDRPVRVRFSPLILQSGGEVGSPLSLEVYVAIQLIAFLFVSS